MKFEEKETQLLSLFHIHETYVPDRLKEYLHSEKKTEKIAGLKMSSIKTISETGIAQGTKFDLVPLDRMEKEYFEVNAAQIVSCICIHDDYRCLFLQLTNDTPVDGYVKGSITYPQGHCRWDTGLINRVPKNDDESYTLKTPEFVQLLRAAAFREFTEEVKLRDYYQNMEFCNIVSDKLNRCNATTGDVVPVYINKPGSIGRHIGFIFEVAFPGNDLVQYEKILSTNEPEKHNVFCFTYDQLLTTIGRVDLICPWVSYSFQKIPFFRSKFIQPYLHKNKKKDC